jgi:uncharacterized protein (UPF0332 family)
VSPEAQRYLEKARHCLDNARVNLSVHLGDDAGRNAYLTAFHAAQALIYECAGKSPKTHQGVHSQFDKLAKDEPAIDQQLRRFLAQAYKMKAVADYETGPGSEVPLERASAAIETAQKFVDCIAGLLAAPPRR